MDKLIHTKADNSNNMQQRLLCFFFFYVIAITSSHTQSNTPQYARCQVYFDAQHSLQRLGELGIACDHGEHKKQRFLISDFSEAEQQLLQQNGFRYTVLIADVVTYYQTQNQAITTKANQCTPTPRIPYNTPLNFSLGSMGGFLTYQELLNNLDSMAAKFPHLISQKAAIDSHNLTYENRPIYWVRLSDNPTLQEPEPSVLYNALHHAREPLSMQQLVYYMWYLLENYAVDSSVRYLVDHTQLYFIPCVNPDGYVYNELTNPTGGGLWRKNRRNNGDGTFGVDLNRNYGYAWAYNNQGSSGNSNSDTYRGTAAFSEPETQNMRTFCLQHPIEIALNYHAYGNLLIYPWAYNDQLTPDSTELKEYAAILTQQNKYEFGTNYQTIGYSTNGDADDWLYGEQTQKNKIFSMTPEAGTGGFWTATNNIVAECEQLVWQNLAAAHLLLHFGGLETQNPVVLTNTNAYTNYKLTRYGNQTGNFEVRVLPLSSNIQAVGAAQNYTLNQFATQADSISLQLDPTIQNGDLIRYIVQLDNGYYTTQDTVEQTFGRYTTAVYDNANTFNNWTNLGNADWNWTTQTYHTPTASITDSKVGNYPNNANHEMLLNTTLDLRTATDAQLSFWAKWDVEDDYDYVQLLAAGDDGIFLPLCGNYTNLGTNYQDANAPVYDDSQLDWILETINLQDYLGDSAVQFKIKLVSDQFVEEDGFYLDEWTIKVLDPLLLNHQKHSSTTNWILGKSQPNPAQTQAYIPFDWKSKNEEAAYLKVYTILGQLQYQTKIEPAQNGYNLQIGDWENGLYFYRIEQAGEQTAPQRLQILK